jgi:hypothetical protein
MDEQLYRKRTVSPDTLLGTEFEADENGWCKHCRWARIAHFIRASDGALLCQKDGEVFAVSAGEKHGST